MKSQMICYPRYNFPKPRYVCSFCKDELKKKGVATTKCCNVSCHKWCYNNVKETLSKCPLCYETQNKIIIFYYPNDEYNVLFREIKNRLNPLSSCVLGGTVKLYFPPSGDLGEYRHIKAEIEDNLAEIEDILKTKQKISKEEKKEYVSNLADKLIKDFGDLHIEITKSILSNGNKKVEDVIDKNKDDILNSTNESFKELYEP